MTRPNIEVIETGDLFFIDRLELGDIGVEAILGELIVDNTEENQNYVSAQKRNLLVFCQLIPQLITHYPGEFVAIVSGIVVDHDLDSWRLYSRQRMFHSTEPVFIAFPVEWGSAPKRIGPWACIC